MDIFLKNAVPFLGLCDPVLVGSDDRMMNLNDSIFQSAFLPQSLFLIKKLFPLFPARIGTAAYRRHHRSFRQRSYNLWVFDWKMIGLAAGLTFDDCQLPRLLLFPVVLTRRGMRSSTNAYLTALAIADLVYLLCVFWLSLRHYPHVREDLALSNFYAYTWPYSLWLTDATSMYTY